MLLRASLLALGLALSSACATSSPSTAPPTRPPAPPTPAELEAKASIEGRLSKREIGAVIRGQLNRYLECYDLMLALGHRNAGTVRLRIVIAPTGKVQEATIADTDLHAPRTEACMRDVTYGLHFPQPTDGGMVVVTFPFHFQPS